MATIWTIHNSINILSYFTLVNCWKIIDCWLSRRIISSLTLNFGAWPKPTSQIWMSYTIEAITQNDDQVDLIFRLSINIFLRIPCFQVDPFYRIRLRWLNSTIVELFCWTQDTLLGWFPEVHWHWFNINSGLSIAELGNFLAAFNFKYRCCFCELSAIFLISYNSITHE